jgi:hypothetical protein
MILTIEKTPSLAMKNRLPFTTRYRSATISNCDKTTFTLLTVTLTHIVNYRNISVELRKFTHKYSTNDESPQPT